MSALDPPPATFPTGLLPCGGGEGPSHQRQGRNGVLGYVPQGQSDEALPLNLGELDLTSEEFVLNEVDGKLGRLLGGLLPHPPLQPL